jgi:two-component system response regulator HydG
MARILVVDDDRAMAETIADGLGERGYDAVPCASSRDAAKKLEEGGFDALVTDLRMPHASGLDLLEVSRRHEPTRPVILMTAYSAIDTAVESIRRGAYHYLTKPFKVEELALFLERALGESSLRKEAKALRRALEAGLDEMVGKSAAMREVAELVMRVADADAPVLVVGETGTGKGVVARAIHANGRRADRAFLAVNCASLPENLLESEIFGHVKGAFTGATATRAGLFEEADGGTLFLDEIGEMAPALQAKLLHVLESGTVRAVGSNKEKKVDVRIVAATHRDLRDRVGSGAFREDLLYRLDVVTIALPPLRRRREDIPELVHHFLARARKKTPRAPVHGFDEKATKRLLEYDWPGNVRELEHVIDRAVLLGRAKEATVEDLPPALQTTAKRARGLTFEGEVLPLREVQRRYAQWAFERLGERKMQTAEQLDVDYKTLQKLLGE